MNIQQFLIIFYFSFSFISDLKAKTTLTSEASVCMCDPVSDSLALVAFYNATSGINWDLNQPMSTWSGIGLTGQGCVMVISFLHSNISGTLPTELENLSSLQRLELGGNNFTGTIPVELGNIASLTNLSLFSNQLTGTIPIELRHLSNLRQLSLSSNELTGNIPPQLGELTKLTDLSLGQNQLDGTIPTELGNLNLLMLLGLYSNQLTGTIPSSLANLTAINFLWLNDNQLSGNIPPGLGNLTTLKQFGLDNNQLEGSIPSEFGDLVNLIILRLHNNNLSGAIPTELGNCTALYRLSISDNNLTGDIPVEIGNLTNLTHIYFQNNNLEGCFPSELSIFCDLGFNTNVHTSGYNFSGNINLPGGGDFTAFCNDQTGSCNMTSEVWPGDTNADGVVNYHDVLTLNLKQGKTGLPRSNATAAWTAQATPDWGDSTPDGIDAKHADCDGDGLVDNSTDAPIVSANYGSTHGNGTSSFLANFSGNALLSPFWNNPSPPPNTIELGLTLEQLIGTNIEFYGIGFTLDYSDVASSVTVNVNNSGMGQEGVDLHAFSQDLGNGEIDIALSRTDGNTVTTTSANNQLCALSFLLNNTPSPNELQLRFHNIQVIDAAGEEVLPMLGSSATIHFSPGSGFVAPLSVLINAEYVEDCSEGASAVAMPAGGTGPYNFHWSNGSTDSEASNLSVGMHQVTVSDAANNSLVSNIEIFGDCVVLPLEWLNFKAIPQQSDIQLEWTIAEASNINAFDIERSIDGKIFSTIGQQLFSYQSNNFYFLDKDVQKNTTYYYRIKALESAKHFYSEVVSLRLIKDYPNIQVFPNPVQENLVIEFGQAVLPDTEMVLLDAFGQKLKHINVAEGVKQAVLNVGDLQSGVYFITIFREDIKETFKVTVL